MNFKSMQSSVTKALKSALLIMIVSGIAGCEKKEEQVQMKNPPPQVSTIVINTSQVELTTELPGRTSPYEIAQIIPRVNGIIEKRHFEEGSFVKQGELLYEIDDAPFVAALKSAKASLRQAKAALPPAQSREKRFKKLLKGNAVSQQEYDDVLSNMEQILAQIDFLKAEVEKAEINLSYTRVNAPISGIIGKSNVTKGALVLAYQTTELARIQRLDPVYIDVTQSSAKILELRKGIEKGIVRKDDQQENRVKIILEDESIYPLEGVFKFRDVRVNPQTGSSILRIVVPNPNHMLLPGMYVRAAVSEGIVNDAILAPHQAVARTPKGEPYVMVVKNNIVEKRILEIKRAIGNQWLVTKGLKSGDHVIMEGIMNVRSGVEVSESPFLKDKEIAKKKSEDDSKKIN